MPDCQDEIYSNDYFDFIVAREYLDELPKGEYCMQQLSDGFGTVHYQMMENGTRLQMQDFSYRVIPKCFGLLNNEALAESGILRVRDQPNLSLTGRGVLMGFIDTEERVIIVSFQKQILREGRAACADIRGRG